MQVLVDNHHGIYVPQVFVSTYNVNKFGIEEFDPDYQSVLQGPENEWYWESWDAILNKASYTDENGNTLYLEHNGDLFLVAEEDIPIFY